MFLQINNRFLILLRIFAKNIKLQLLRINYHTMKNYLFYTILTLAVFIFGCTNNEIPSDTTEIGIEQKNKLTILNDINEFKDFVVIEDTLNYAIWRDFPDSQSVAIGYFNDCTIIMESDSVRRPTHINCDNIIDISFLYKLDTTFVFYKYDESLVGTLN